MITDASETSVIAANGRYMPAPAPYLLVYHMNPPKSSLSTGSDLILSKGSDLGLSLGLSKGSDPVIVDGRRGLLYNTDRQRIVARGQKTARPMRTGTDMKQRNSKQDKNPIKRTHGIASGLYAAYRSYIRGCFWATAAATSTRSKKASAYWCSATIRPTPIRSAYCPRSINRCIRWPPTTSLPANSVQSSSPRWA